jgi:cholesterol oxidase
VRRLGRRNFIKAGAYLGALASASLSTRHAAASLHTKRTYRRAVVIGSGFGGSVATLRLAQAGIPTALVERGRSWEYRGTNTFPTTSDAAAGDPRAAWMVPGYAGLLERIAGDTTAAIVAAGLGGGSLMFGGVLYQPRRALFEEVFPYLDYDEMDAVYYPRVLSRISGGPVPDDVLASPNYAAEREFIATAQAAGLQIDRPEMCVDWDIVRAEIAGKIAPAASVGEYVFGCNSNAKNSLDKNYLADALHTGHVSIHVLHVVTDIVQTRRGLYEVHCDVIDEHGAPQHRHVFVCEQLFMGSGAINTPKLLLKAKQAGGLPDLNGAVGKFWGNNGDYLMARVGVSTPLGAVQGGPPCIAAFDDTYKPLTFLHAPTNSAPNAGFQQSESMSIPEQLGEVTYDAAQDRALVHWPFDANAPSREAYGAVMQEMADAGGGTVIGEDQLGAAAAIWHPLGGAVMGHACSELGEVHGQPNLYVLDGSLLPGSSAAANPSLTIAANAERIMDQLVPKLCRR